MLFLSERTDIRCPVCGSTIPEGVGECPKCGLNRESIEGRSESDDSIADADERLDKIEQMEEKEEERTDMKERVNTTIQDLNDILEFSKKIDIDLGSVRNIISKSLELSREGRADKALDVLEKARDKSSTILRGRIDSMLSELEGEKASIFDDRKKNELEQYIEKASKAKDKNRFEKSYGYITRGKKLVEKYRLKIEGMTLTEIIKIKELSENIGLDCSEVEELIAEAKREYEKGNIPHSKDALKKAKEKLLKMVSQKIQKIMKEGMKELEEAKKRDKDISRPVSYLKQSNLMIKKKKFIEALEYVNKFTESLEQISEEGEAPSTTVGRVEKKTRSQLGEKKTTGTVGETGDEALTPSNQEETDQTKSTSSFSGLKDEDRTVEFDIDEFYEGSTNLLKVKDLSKAYDLFKELVKESGAGVCVTREYPEKVKKKYSLLELIDERSTDNGEIDFSMIWLSNVDNEEAIKPRNMGNLSLKLESFITGETGIILLNGLEFLVSNNNFKTVLHLIQSLKDQVAIEGALLLITATPESFDKSQLNQLEREVDEVF